MGGAVTILNEPPELSVLDNPVLELRPYIRQTVIDGKKLESWRQPKARHFEN